MKVETLERELNVLISAMVMYGDLNNDQIELLKSRVEVVKLVVASTK